MPAWRSARKKAALPSPTDGVEDDVGPGAADRLDDCGEVAGAERRVGFADDLAAHRAGDVPDDGIDRVRKHGVGADEKHAAPERLERPRHGRHDRLIGCGAGVDGEGRALEPFVLHGIEEEVPAGFDHRRDLPAARRCPAAESRRDTIGGDQPFGLAREGGRIRGAVTDDGFERPTEHAARCVQFLDRHQRRLGDGPGADRHRAGERLQDADADGRRRAAAEAEAEGEGEGDDERPAGEEGGAFH